MMKMEKFIRILTIHMVMVTVHIHFHMNIIGHGKMESQLEQNEWRIQVFELYEIIVNELYNSKTISALLFLIDNGRELSFLYNDIEYSITWKDKLLYLDNEKHDNLQMFDNAWELIENSKIEKYKFLEVWNDIKLLTLF